MKRKYGVGTWSILFGAMAALWFTKINGTSIIGMIMEKINFDNTLISSIALLVIAVIGVIFAVIGIKNKGAIFGLILNGGYIIYGIVDLVLLLK